MGKGANSQLLANSGTAQTNSAANTANAKQIYGPLTSQLQNEAASPQGYTPQQMAYMNTASQQSLGGSTGGETGQANLEAARTRNAGGFQGAAGTAGRSNARQLSTNALGIQQSQANLQQQQQQQALSSLQSLYGVDQNTALGYLSNSNTALNDEEQASAAQQANLMKGISTGINFLGTPGPAAAFGQ